jgi:putative Mg2+ transporter-C (MgtC) family protein
MELCDNNQIQIFLQLLLAAILGGLVGLERGYKRKEAGLRTYALVSVGSALFTIIGFEIFSGFISKTGISFDPSRIIAAVVMGVGFIGTGLIIYRQFHIEGLTTAAGLWLVAAIGSAVGSQLYMIAIFAAFLGIGILSGLRLIEEKLFGKDSEEAKK